MTPEDEEIRWLQAIERIAEKLGGANLRRRAIVMVIREAVAEEREACAKIALRLSLEPWGRSPVDVRQAIAAAIRGRGQ